MRRWADPEDPFWVSVVDTMLLSSLLYNSDTRAVQPHAKVYGKVRSSHSLSAVAMRELGITLDKGHQKADWGGPLTLGMIEYAASDTRILLPIRDALEAKIDEADL